MKVALVTNFCPFYRVKLFALLAERIGARFLFFSDATEKNWEALNPRGGGNLPVVPLCVPPAPRWHVMLRLVRELRRGDYDVFLQGLSGRWAVLVTWLVARLRRKPLVIWTGIWCHPQTFAHRLTFPLVRHICRSADAVVVYGTHVRDYLVSNGVASEKIFIGWNTADNEQYSKAVSPADADALRRELGIGDRKVILYVGRLDEGKGLETLLQGMITLNFELSLIRREEPVLLIVGRGQKEADLKAFCASNALGNVKFLDYVPNDQLYKYYHLATALVVPSVTTRVFREPWGLIVNEAMNQGCVVIASDAVGAARGGLLEHGVNGLVFPEGDFMELGDALEKILTDDAYRATLSQAARSTIAGWTYDRMAQGFIDAVHHAYQSRHRP